MLQKEEIVSVRTFAALEQFRVMYYHQGWPAKKLVGYDSRLRTYVAACEFAEQLRAQYGEQYTFKVLHKKLVGREV